MPDVDLDKLFKRLDAVLSTAAEDAFTMPGEFYTSAAFLDLEREQLFRRKWVCLGRAEEIPAAGDYLATELVGEPIVLVRTPLDEIKALYKKEGKSPPKQMASTVYYNRGILAAAIHLKAMELAVKAKGSADITGTDVQSTQDYFDGIHAISDANRILGATYL